MAGARGTSSFSTPTELDKMMSIASVHYRSVGDPQGRWAGETGSVPHSLGVGTWAMQTSCELQVSLQEAQGTVGQRQV